MLHSITKLCLYQIHFYNLYIYNIKLISYKMIGPSRSLYVQSESSDEQQQNQKQLPQISQQNQSDSNNSYKLQQQTQNTTTYYDLGIPVDAFAALQGHRKTVTAIDVDPKGYRMVTGSLDYTMRMWDFHGMNKSMNSFRVTQPIAGNAIRNLSYNTTGTHILVVCGGKQVMMVDKDGAKGLLTVKGYMYIKNLHKTKGHTGTVYDGTYHPINSNQFVTCSGDGSIRLWDMQQKLQGIEEELAHKTLLTCWDQTGHMVGVTGVNYTNDGKMVFGGCLDGSLQGFSTKNNLHRPQMLVRNAHTPHQQYTKILSYEDGKKIATRNMDGSLKIWDLRMFKHPIMQEFNLPNYFPGSKMCFSPNYQYLLVGTSTSKLKQEQQSQIYFYDSQTLQIKRKMSMGNYSVTDIKWSKILNQIIIGTSQNQAKIYFDERISKKGAVQCIHKQPRIEKDYTFGYTAPVYLPHSLPLYKTPVTNNNKKQLRRVRKDAILSQKPQLPQQGPNKNGKQVVAHTVVQHMIQTLNANPQKVDDARIPILQVANYTSTHHDFTEAYQITQPNAIFNHEPSEQKEFELLAKIKEICPHCGMKLCTCARKYQIDPLEQV